MPRPHSRQRSPAPPPGQSSLGRPWQPPLTQSLRERARNAPVTDPGWAQFFRDLDAGKFQGDLIVPEYYKVAEAMARNHIASDLQRSLARNGIGRKETWSAIGGLVHEQMEHGYRLPLEKQGAQALQAVGWVADVARLRQQKREELEAQGIPRYRFENWATTQPGAAATRPAATRP